MNKRRGLFIIRCGSLIIRKGNRGDLFVRLLILGWELITNISKIKQSGIVMIYVLVVSFFNFRIMKLNGFVLTGFGLKHCYETT
jgi:hypothetical protein